MCECRETRCPAGAPFSERSLGKSVYYYPRISLQAAKIPQTAALARVDMLVCWMVRIAEIANRPAELS